MDARLATTDEATAGALKSAHRQRLAKFAWQFGGIGAVLAAMVMGLISIGANALFDFGLTGGGVALALTLIPVVAAVAFFVASKRAGRRTQEEIEVAWERATNRIYQASGGRVDANQLAEVFGIDTEQATEMLARAEVDQLLSTGGDPLRVRVQEPPGGVEQPGDAAAGQLSDEELARRELEEALGNAPTEQFRVDKPTR
jgi:hypothetical protein